MKLPIEIHQKIWKIFFINVLGELVVQNPPKNIISTRQEQLDCIRSILQYNQDNPNHLKFAKFIHYNKPEISSPTWLCDFLTEIYNKPAYYHLQFHIDQNYFSNNNKTFIYIISPQYLGPHPNGLSSCESFLYQTYIFFETI